MLRVAAKLGNVIAHPLERFHLVPETVVGRRVAADIGQEAVQANAVVEVDDHHAALGRLDESRPVIVGIGVGIEAAALYEEEDGQLGRRSGVGRPVDVQEQAVFGLRGKGGLYSFGIGAEADLAVLQDVNSLQLGQGKGCKLGVPCRLVGHRSS